MPRKVWLVSRAAFVTILMIACASLSWGQFTGTIQGTVHDPSGATVPKAAVVLVNTATQVTRSTTSDSGGSYNFTSLAPGTYTVTAESGGFRKSQVDVTLLTSQTLGVDIALQVGAVSDSVTVTTEAPVMDTSDSRNQLTIENEAVAQLPVAGRNLVTLVTFAPGVSGLGTGALVGTPASGADNFSTEEAVDANANGQGSNNNQYVVDGLDVTSGIRQGVLNLTPTPDSIQETSIQVNTYSSQYSRAAGLQTMFTTKSGSDRYHGSAADYFNYQRMFAHQWYQGVYKPWHVNDMSFAIGGPVIPHRKLFFWFAVEPKRSSISAGGLDTFPAPEFLAFTQSTPALAGTVGTHILNTYLPTGITSPHVQLTAEALLGTGVNGCNTAASNFIPCSLPVVDQGSFGATSIRNGTQYFVRIDKPFANDTIYGSLYRTVLTTGAPTPTPQFSTLNPTWQISPQVTWTHTFSPSTINDASFGISKVEGKLGTGAKDYTVPDINAGINMDAGLSYGVGFAQGDFIQHNYHWRDVLTHIQGAHVLKFGYEGWYGDDVENFEAPWSTPTINFNNLLSLAQDSPNFEGGVFYNPQTGKQQNANWNAASRTFGLFAEDTWKARKNLTLTLGLRYDDSGNPWSKNATTVFGNFYYGTGTTVQQQIANGYAKGTHNALLHAVNDLFSPRAGFSWDPTGRGDWVVRGGGGMYNNWLTSANVQEEFRGSPPGLVNPSFFPGGTANAGSPILAQGTGNTAPFGFTFPTFAGGLNSQGGVVGASFQIGGIDPLLKSPKANVWSLSVERKITNNFAGSVGYSGSHSYNMVGGGNNTGTVSYGVNINVLPGDLITNESLTPTRLNTSFGPIFYSQNDRRGNYEAVFFEVKGHFTNGFVDASYTHSAGKDNAGSYPTPFNPEQYYGPSTWDVPNRVSLTLNYELKGLNHGKGIVGYTTGGWGISGTSIYQSGEPISIINTNSYQPVCALATTVAPCPSFANPATGYGPQSGDYNADGNNNDYPDVSAYKQDTSKKGFINGSIPTSDFSTPTFGSEGNERSNLFRQPNFAETDANIYKETNIAEGVKFQIRFEFYNLFNRANLANVQQNITAGNFGQTTGAHLPRYWQVGGRLSF
jgi:hypothetical protein